MFDFKEEKLNLSELIAGHLKGGLFGKIRPYLVGDKLKGSVQFDHFEAITLTLRHDAEHEGELTRRVGSGDINHVAIWKAIALALKREGHNMKRGNLVGLALI